MGFSVMQQNYSQFLGILKATGDSKLLTVLATDFNTSRTNPKANQKKKTPWKEKGTGRNKSEREKLTARRQADSKTGG
jgi:hypothetical protein